MQNRTKVRRRVLACARCRKRKLSVRISSLVPLIPHWSPAHEHVLTTVAVRWQSAGLHAMCRRWRQLRGL